MNPNTIFVRKSFQPISTTKSVLMTNVSESEAQNENYKAFELLYDKYSPKMFGFIIQHTTKKKAEEFLINVFLKIWADLKSFELNTDEKILAILLSECRPIFKK